MTELRRHLRGRLHLFGLTEADFVMPPPGDARLRRTAAGLELALTDALAELERQGRHGLLLVAWPGAGTGAFLDGLRGDADVVLRLDAWAALSLEAPPPALDDVGRSSASPVVTVEGLHRLDPDEAVRASAVLERWAQALPGTRFVVTTRPGAVPPDRMGPGFLEVRVAGLDASARRQLVRACLARLHGVEGRPGPGDPRPGRPPEAPGDEIGVLADDLLRRLAAGGRRAPGCFRLLTSPLALTALAALDTAGAPLPADGSGLLEAWRAHVPDDGGLLGPWGEVALRAFAGDTPTAGSAPPEAPWVHIPPGSFRMGSPDDEEGRWADEGPVHEVRMPGFELGAWPVTNAAYAAWLEAEPGAPVPAWWDDPEFTRPEQPVVGVGWDEARAYAAWAGARLPSEAEWEYACRAGTTGARYGELEEVAWFRGNSGATLRPVGRRRGNPWGVHDTLGNAWEWVEDDHHGGYDGAPTDGRPWTDDPRSLHRILRGGSWADAPRVPRAATRLRDHPGPRIGNVGFRVARSRRARIAVAEGAGEEAEKPGPPGRETRSSPGSGGSPASEAVTVAVVGGGVAGSAVALALTRLGLECAGYERVESDGATGLGVILMPDGLAALDRLGLGDEVRALGVTARRAERRNPSDRLLEERDLPEHVCVFRHRLVEVLQAGLPPGVLRWGREVRSLEASTPAGPGRLTFGVGPAVTARAVVGADGRHSLVREWLSPGTRLLPTDVRELINVVSAPSLARELSGRLVKYVAADGGLAVGLAPTADGHVFWYVQWETGRGGPTGRDPASFARFAEEVTDGWEGPLPGLVADTDYRESYLSEVTAMPPLERLSRGSVVLVGDAAHPLPTLLGEGANTALEDATELADTVADDPGDLPGAFARFARRRRPRWIRLHEEGRRAVRGFLQPTHSNSAAP